MGKAIYLTDDRDLHGEDLRTQVIFPGGDGEVGTDIKATVGLRTTSLYRSTGGGLAGVQGIASMDTKDHVALRSTLGDLA